MTRQRLVPLTMAAALAEYQLVNAEGYSADHKLHLAGQWVAAMSDAEWDDLAERNQMRMDSAAMKLNATAIKLNGPRARLLVQDPPRTTRKLPLTEAEMERRGQ